MGKDLNNDHFLVTAPFITKLHCKYNQYKLQIISAKINILIWFVTISFSRAFKQEKGIC